MNTLQRLKVSDGFTRAGAKLLADTINAYWAARGQRAHAHTFHARELPEFAGVDAARIPDYYVVRSAMINGGPS